MDHIKAKISLYTSSASENGAALVEAVIGLGVLAILLLATFDLFFLFKAYTNISQIGREGVLSGMTLWQDFNRDDSCNDTTHVDLPELYQYCSTGNAGDNTCGHQMVHWKILKAIQAKNVIKTENYTITTNCVRIGAQFRLTVEIKATFIGLLPVFQGASIKSVHLGVITSAP
jgi:hypothetical protein